MAEQKTGRAYDAKVRRQAVKVLATGAGHRALASKLGIPDATARQWARSYAAGGKVAVMNAGATHRVYPFELKLSAVKDRLENGMSVREVMIKHGIPSESSVKTWCRQYRAHGEEALVNKPRGVKPRAILLILLTSSRVMCASSWSASVPRLSAPSANGLRAVRLRSRSRARRRSGCARFQGRASFGVLALFRVRRF